jgi:histidinol phosphatase-like enzyme (inositol monophosphatase family)
MRKNSPFAELLHAAIDIAESAAEVAKSYFRGALLIEIKDNQTPVTIADKKTEEVIRREVERRFPDHGILGEEFGHAPRERSELTWTIDPIDGTRSFIRGIPLWGTLLGVLHRDEPVVGVMVLPMLGETYAAAKGMGTQCNGTPIHVSPVGKFDKAVVSVGDRSCFSSTKTLSVLERLENEAELVRSYTDCFGHALVARGGADAMIDPMVSVWDVAPIACIVEEAGGRYGNFEGRRTVHDSTFVTCGRELGEALFGRLTRTTKRS